LIFLNLIFNDLSLWLLSSAIGRVPVVASEAHDCLARCVRTSMIRPAHQAGVRRLAMEALPWPAPGTQGPIRDLPAVAVAFRGWVASWEQPPLASLEEVLTAYGGTAGILREQAPPPLNTHAGADAVVVSADNALT
jgi:hypothetical protein